MADVRPSFSPPAEQKTEQAALRVLLALSVAHLANDTLQAVLPALYPLLKDGIGLTFTQIGMITLVAQCTGSILQPVVGAFTDRRPIPYSLPIGMLFTLAGLVLLSQATRFPTLLVSAALTGAGSAIFHPEASRLARLASGGRHGFAQSLFQLGGNFGTSIGPLLVALLVAPFGQGNALWFSLIAGGAFLLLMRVGRWYARHLALARAGATTRPPATASSRQVAIALTVLVALMFSKYVYLASLTNYYTFYLIDRFQLTIQSAQLSLFLFLFACAAGTILGGPIGDRFGRKRVIWASILGVAPFSLAMPYVGLAGTLLLSVPIGLLLASAFPAIVVYAQELLPGRVGMIAGLFFGLAFGTAGVSAAILGKLADHWSIDAVYHVCSFLPLLGVVAVFLPELNRRDAAA